MRFIVEGGRRLAGEVTLAGAKNAATKMMVASLLTEEACVLENVPQIGDVDITAELCKQIGSWVNRSGATLAVHTPEVKNSHVAELSRRNRIPILAIGPLLARKGEAEVPVLGGDKLGPRPVDFHLETLKALGAEVEVREKSYYARVKGRLHGSTIEFPFPSVGATESALLASVLAEGKTVIKNAALEPEIIDLVKMLQKMGAIIELGANRDFYVEGVSHLHGVTHSVLPDRNEAVSFACLAIATGGEIMVKGAIQDHLITFLNVVRRLGAGYRVFPDGIAFFKNGSLRPLAIETASHPGFMTDWQQPLAVLLTQVEGISTIHETIYEDRFGYAEDLKSLGAKITTSTECSAGSSCRMHGKGCVHKATIEGPASLLGGKLRVRDLRSGMVNVTAALVARGKSEIEGVDEIDRGYEKIDERLRALGAKIERVG